MDTSKEEKSLHVIPSFLLMQQLAVIRDRSLLDCCDHNGSRGSVVRSTRIAQRVGRMRTRKQSECRHQNTTPPHDVVPSRTRTACLLCL
jgi:hypothetical protein